MAQVITPPAAGEHEEAGKNWHRAEALRRIGLDLRDVWAHLPQDNERVRKLLHEAGEKIAKARLILAPPPVPTPQPKPVRY